MAFDPTAPVAALIIEPNDDVATLPARIAHRLYAWPVPNDTICGRALIVGEGQGRMEISSAST